MPTIQSHIQSLSLEALFIEELGWDRPQGARALYLPDGQELKAVAQKRGFVVLFAPVSLLDIRVRNRLIRIQKEVAAVVHEHLLICADPGRKRQVWMWSYRGSEGKRRLHREHPFFSIEPPASLVQRISGLRFDLEEEEFLTVLDASGRVRGAMDVAAENTRLFRKEHKIVALEKMWSEIQAGSIEALHAFAMQNRRLATWVARGYRNHGVEVEDLNQIAFWSLMRAIKRFDPQYGTRFSTYATLAIRQWCQFHVGRQVPLLKMPTQYWTYVRRNRLEERLAVRYGYAAAKDRLGYWAGRTDEGRLFYEQIRRGIEVTRLGAPKSNAYRTACEVEEKGMPLPMESALKNDLREKIYGLLTRLHPDDAEMVQRYYGLKFPVHTLEEIGEVFGLTRERIRQRLERSVSWMTKMQSHVDAACEARRSNLSTPIFVVPLHPEAKPKIPKPCKPPKKKRKASPARKVNKPDPPVCIPVPRQGGVKFKWSCDAGDEL